MTREESDDNLTDYQIEAWLGIVPHHNITRDLTRALFELRKLRYLKQQISVILNDEEVSDADALAAIIHIVNT